MVLELFQPQSTNSFDVDMNMAAFHGDSIDRGTCSSFQPQKWRNGKCKVCFRDKKDHYYIDGLDKNLFSYAEKCSTGESDNRQVNINGGKIQTSRDILSTIVYDKKKQADMKSSDSKRIKDCSHFNEDDDDDDDDATMVNTSANNRSKSVIHRSPKFLKTSRKDVVKLAAFEWSSNSSMASLDTFNSDDVGNLSEGSTMADEDDVVAPGENSMLEKWSCEDENENTNTYEHNLDKIFDLQRQMEELKGSNRILKLSKDRETQCLEKEIGNLRLELANFSARENLTVLKNRLELEGKSLRIEDLENETKHFRSEIDRLTMPGSPTEETLAISRELDRKIKKIAALDEENRSLEDSLRLAEDLQNNDRELLGVLRNQVEALENDHKKSSDKNKQLEDKIKQARNMQLELEREREKNVKMTRHLENLNEKLKHREKHIGDLEDDNVKLQQLKNELESRLMHESNAHQRQDANISDLQVMIDQSDSEVKRLSLENKRLRESRKKAGSVLQSYVIELEDRVDQVELQNRRLEETRDAAIRDSKTILHRLHESDHTVSELQRELEESQLAIIELEQLDKDNEKQLLAIRKRLLKADKHKKKAVHELLEMDRKLNDIKEQYEETVCRCEDTERDVRMLRLKLQSTEAKMAVIQNNKLYLESRLESARKRVGFEGTQSLPTRCNLVDFSQNLTSPPIRESIRLTDTPCNDLYITETKELLADNLLQIQDNDRTLTLNADHLTCIKSMMAALEQQLETTKHLLSTKSTENVELREQLAYFDQETKKFVLEKDHLLQKMREIMKDNRNLNAKVKDLRHHVQQLENVIHDEHDNIHSTISSGKLLSDLINEMEEKDHKIKDLENRILSKDDIISTLHEKMDVLNIDSSNILNSRVPTSDYELIPEINMSMQQQHSSPPSVSDCFGDYAHLDDEVFESRDDSVNNNNSAYNVEATPQGLIESSRKSSSESIEVNSNSATFKMPQFVQGQRICINVPLPLDDESDEEEVTNEVTALPDMRFECDMDEDNIVSNVTVRSLNGNIRVNQQPNHIVHVTIMKDGSIEKTQETEEH